MRANTTLVKTFTLLALFIVSIADIGLAQTNVPGGNVNGIWTLANSPYSVQGSIQIPNGDSLIIEPGVVVEFQGHYKLYVQGKVMAIGTVADTISFTAADTAVGWQGIRFDATSDSNDTSRIVYCKIQYGKTMATNQADRGGGIYIYNFSKVVVSNCYISNCVAYYGGGGIYCKGTPVITNNTIMYNRVTYGDGGGGIMTVGSAIVTFNTVTNNAAPKGGGIFIGGLEPIVSNNIFSYNSHSGIYCNKGTPIISNNTVSYNVGEGIYARSIGVTITGNTVLNNLRTGVLCKADYSHTISNNTVSYNSSGIRCDGGWYTDTCEIFNNIVTYNDGTYSNNNYVGGISVGKYTSNSTNTIAYVHDNIITNNVGKYGGGVHCQGYSNTVIFNNIISNNRSAKGGGILCHQSPTVTNNIITYNSSGSLSDHTGGGGIYSENATPTISNNLIANNTSLGYASNGGGGGIYSFSGAPIISNNTIVNNTDSSGNGGGIIIYSSNPLLTNNTISNNAVYGVGGKGGAIFCSYGSDPIFRNCIFYGNVADTGSTVYLDDEASDPGFYYCDLEGGIADFGFNNCFYTGVYSNNLDLNPLFAVPTLGTGIDFNGMNADWSLQVGSPCINTGNPIGLFAATDMAGNPRIVGGRIDMGAFEYQGGACVYIYGDTINPTACENYTVPSGNEIYTISGFYLDTIPAVSGCDSIVPINLSIGPAIPVSFTGLNSIYCSVDGPVDMVGVPPGGTFTGTGGVSGNKFYPATGPGTYTITYMYVDINGCEDNTSQDVVVALCTTIDPINPVNYFKFYPNPTTGVLHLVIQNFEVKKVVEILDYTGRLVYAQSIKANEQEVSLNINNLSPGVYFIRIGTVTRKVILQ